MCLSHLPELPGNTENLLDLADCLFLLLFLRDPLLDADLCNIADMETLRSSSTSPSTTSVSRLGGAMLGGGELWGEPNMEIINPIIKNLEDYD